ncbi:MAG: hypothetical protein KDI07_21445 [Anaerolineae bacterium]|nr:hypothetical protein [Anaerolineae bacterium]MCB0251150.1 hypothetical protein [Anaerolineae bacterium]MCB9131949.1 hypothetical protein [Anaerolineales bacterium]
MRQGLVRLILLVIVLLVIFGVYRLLTVEPIEAGVFFDPASKPLVFLNPGATTDDAAATLAAFAGTQRTGAAGFFAPVSLNSDGQLTFVSDGEGASQAVNLPALLEAFPDVRFVVELTEPSLQSLAALLQAVDSQNARDRVLAVVDDQQLVDTLRGQAPDLATAMTAAETDSFLLTSRLRLTPFYRPVAPALLLPADQFSQPIATAAHSSGVSVFVVSPGDSAAVQRLIDQGADGVVAQ